MSNRTHINRRRSYRVHVQQSYERLSYFKSKNDTAAFYSLFLKLLPELKKYIKSRIQELIHQGHFPHNTYQVFDFIDDLFLSIYDQFEEINTEEDFYLLLFSEIDRLLNNAQEIEEFRHNRLEHLDLFTAKERTTMKERYTAQLDGDLIMKEELDDISYYRRPEEEIDVSVDMESILFEKIDSEIRKEFTYAQLEELLKELPVEEQHIATLFLHFHLTIPEIAKISKRKYTYIQQVIHKIKNALETSLFNR